MGDRLVRWLPYVLLAMVVADVVVQAARPISDPDDWWHLRLGADLIQQGSLTAPAHWSTFGTVDWVPTEPVPEIVATKIEEWFGLPGLAWLFGLAAVLVLVTVQVTNRREGTVLPATIATVLTAVAASGSMSSRPQLVSFVLLPIIIAAWLRTERDLKPRWWLVPLSWAWSLCHGFWFIGAAYGGVVVVGLLLSRRVDNRRLLTLVAVPLASFAVVALNPAGLGVLEAPFAVHSTSPYIEEWARTDLLHWAPLGTLVMIVATVVVWVATRRAVSWVRVLLLLSACFWLWFAMRTVVIAGLVTAPLLTGALQTLLNGSQAHEPAPRVPRPSWRELGVVAGWSTACLIALALVVPRTAAEPGDVPVGLDASLDRLPAGATVWNDYALGGWLRWRHPELNPVIDGLITPYPVAHIEAYHDAMLLRPGWERTVSGTDATAAVVVDRSDLSTALQREGWTSAGRDAGFVLLLRPGRS